MGLETRYSPVERFVNRTAESLFSSRLEQPPYQAVEIAGADIVQRLADKKHLIGVFGPHKTIDDSTLLTNASITVCPERALTFLSRPPSREEHSTLGYLATTLKHAVNPLLHPVYTMRDTNPRYLFEKNEISMKDLAKYHKRVKPTMLYIAPDGGSSPGGTLDRRYVRSRGLLILLGAYLLEGIALDDIAVLPVALKTRKPTAQVAYGENLLPGIGDLLPDGGEKFWMDGKLNAQVAEALLQSVNSLLA